MTRLVGKGRVYLGPDDGSPHGGYRGSFKADVLGVHVGTTCDWLLVKGVDSEWVPVETPVLIPWHRVDCIEWRDDA